MAKGSTVGQGDARRCTTQDVAPPENLELAIVPRTRVIDPEAFSLFKQELPFSLSLESSFAVCILFLFGVLQLLLASPQSQHRRRV